jgi:hypothetical protein
VSKRSVCVLLSAMVSLQGCGAILFPTQQEVPVECPTVATASFRVPSAGTSARSGAALKLDRRKDYTVEVQAPGHATQTVRVESELSISRAIVSIVLNGSHGIFTLFITTFIGCFADIRAGAWQVLEPTELVVELTADGSPPPAPAATTSSWPTASPTPSGFCESCGARAGSTDFCTSCGARVRR